MDVFSKKRKLQNLDEVNDNYNVTHQSANKLITNTNNEVSFIADPDVLDEQDNKNMVHVKART